MKQYFLVLVLALAAVLSAAPSAAVAAGGPPWPNPIPPKQLEWLYNQQLGRQEYVQQTPISRIPLRPAWALVNGVRLPTSYPTAEAKNAAVAQQFALSQAAYNRWQAALK